MTQLIKARKSGRPVIVELPSHHVFRRPKVYEPIDFSRIVGVDSESFSNRKYSGDLRTNMVQVAYCNSKKDVILDTTKEDHPFGVVFDEIWDAQDELLNIPKYRVEEKRSSRTRQRNKRVRSDGKYRDGRREVIKPVVLIFHGLGYDLGRLIRMHPQFRRAIRAGSNSVRILVGDYEIEIASLAPTGNAPHFEFFVRKDGYVMRVIGRDTWGYWKMTLDRAASKILGDNKEPLPRSWFRRDWEDFSTEEMELVRKYAAKDPKLTRELYIATIELLRSISKYAITRSGLIPISASGAAAKMAFAKAEPPVRHCADENGEVKEIYEWHRPPSYIMQMGANSYSGGRVFNTIEGYQDNVWGRDYISAYGYVMTLLPDPATCEYREVEVVKYIKYRQADWRGKWGCLCVSGEGLDEYYPALRVHDDKHDGRLQGIYGKFRKVWATIPEIVIGVESRRLKITAIHGGVEIVGSAEHSFLCQFVLEMFAIKDSNEEDSPMYLIAKMLINSLSGKLAEINQGYHDLDDYTAYAAIPDVPGIEKEVPRLIGAFVECGTECVEEVALELDNRYMDRCDECDLPLNVVVEMYYSGKPAKAGHYYLPVHASQITGFTSARLGLAAHCTKAVNGHTDSIFTIGEQKEGIQKYIDIMERSGYPEPPEGELGSFRTVVQNASGYLVKGGLYALRDESGEVVKVATHSLQDIPVDIPDGATEKQVKHLKNEAAYDMVEKMAKDGYVKYETVSRPLSLMEAIERGEESGVFMPQHVTATNTLDPNFEKDADGVKIHKPYKRSKHISSPMPPPPEPQEDRRTKKIIESLTPMQKVKWMFETGWPQKEVARNVGCTQQSISAIMLGKRNGELLAKQIDRAYTRRISQVPQKGN